MDEAERLCDRVAVVDHGKCIALGTPQELIARVGGEHVIDLDIDPTSPARPSADELRKLPTVQSVREEGDRVTLTAAEPNPALDPKTFVANPEIKANPVPASVPYQWVIRRLNIGEFLDSDDIFVPRGGSLKLTELAPNVHHITGGTHNGLAVVMKEGIVVFDAPTGDAQARWTIDTLKAKFGKPVKSVVVTHHHSDHSAGVRVYIAERAGLVVPSPDRKFFALLSLSQRPVPDELENKHVSADITEVKDRLDLTDESVEIHLHRIPNPHAEGMLIAHIMPGNIVYETDLWTPGSESGRTPAGIMFAAALKKLGIQNATIAGGHGDAAAPQAEFDRIYATPAMVQ
jgi:glyoxylase-like metal-dependent hydrolase (beta-lactamase superfamily II)